MVLSQNAKNRIKELYKGRKHLELTVGLLNNGKIETIHLDEKKRKRSEKLLYPVGSIAKPFTASMLARFVDEGKMDLDDPLDFYIQDLPERYYPSLLKLSTHHSGYGLAPFNFPQMLQKLLLMNTKKGILHVNPFRGFPDEEKMMKILKNKKLQDKEYKFEYCNFAFGVLGYILGRVSGSDYFTAMNEYLQELGLEDSSIGNIVMTGYDKKGNPCLPWQWEDTDIIAPAGAMVSSMEDLLKFAQMNLDGSLPYVDLCHKKYAEGEKTFDQGLAWRLKKDSDISYHVGNAGAFSCILAIDRKNRKAAAIGMNYAMVDEIEEAAFAMLE